MKNICLNFWEKTLFNASALCCKDALNKPAKHIINRDEFEQTPPAIQLFYHYFKAAGEKTEGEYLSPVEILDYLQKRTTIALSSGKSYHFGRLLQKEEIPSRHTNKGAVYKVVKL